MKKPTARVLRVVLILGIAALVGLVLWRFYGLHKELVTAIGVAIVALLLIGEVLEPFAWLTGLMRSTDSERSKR